MRTLLVLLALAAGGNAEALDHQHDAWTELLRTHVSWNAEGTATQVDYAGFERDRDRLAAYLGALSAVTQDQYSGWSRAEREVFLINAYNAFTVELVLRGGPELRAIKQIGGLLRSPWRQRFFVLLGAERHLDDVEHGLLRGAQDFDEPRIHFAVNCASVGCPALRPEAYTPDRYEQQLEDQTRRFLSDRSRNRHDGRRGVLELSPIFKWYSLDFDRPWRGSRGVGGFVARYAEPLGLDSQAAQAAAANSMRIRYTDYDWALNRR